MFDSGRAALRVRTTSTCSVDVPEAVASPKAVALTEIPNKGRSDKTTENIGMYMMGVLKEHHCGVERKIL
jgi:hypothetical protein